MSQAINTVPRQPGSGMGLELPGAASSVQPIGARPALDLGGRFDAVVMLTSSNWFTEPRSNRYHYAVRFARLLPVFFVQQDRVAPGYAFEATEVPGITVLHVPYPELLDHDKKQTVYCRDLARALRDAGVMKPLLWLSYFGHVDYYRLAHAPLKVCHATELYLDQSYYRLPDDVAQRYVAAMDASDAVVCVSAGVKAQCDQVTGGRKPTLLAVNGCDYEFFEGAARCVEGIAPRVAMYQGGINRRLDFALLVDVARSLPDWEFWLCGEAELIDLARIELWKTLSSLPNVKCLGRLDVEALRTCMTQATVGLIPYEQKDYIRRSLPLKAFEYVACGLPVVTVPIDDLQPYGELFHFASTAEQFAASIQAAAKTRTDPHYLTLRDQAAQQRSYDNNFRAVTSFLSEVRPPEAAAQQANVLVLFDQPSLPVKAVQHHLAGLAEYSKHRIYYAPATANALTHDLHQFDAVVLHSTVRVSVPNHLTWEYYEALREYPGLKILYIQDEYDWTNLACQYIDDLGIHVVFTCVPLDQVHKVYSPARFPHVHFVPTLTGYVPFGHDSQRPVRPMADRKYLIGYRGRRLGYWYGDMGYEKQIIGERMREVCEQRGLRVDIETDDTRRIYGDGWFAFLESCRATLGTESGSNLFDFDGRVKEQIEAELAANPNVSYAEIRARYLAAHEGKIIMNQISPKVFEAIILRTALILFEGTYSGVVRPDEHFIPLKKDFSNVDDVLAKIQDDAYLTALTERAYRDVIESGAFTYRRMAAEFDAVLEQHGLCHRPHQALPEATHCMVPGKTAADTRIVRVRDERAAQSVSLPLPPTV